MIRLFSTVAIFTTILVALLVFFQLTTKNNTLNMPIPGLTQCTAPCEANTIHFSQQRGTTQIKDDTFKLILALNSHKNSQCWRPTTDLQWYGCIALTKHTSTADQIWMRALHSNVKLGDILSVFGRPTAWRACINRNELPDLSHRETIDMRFLFQFTESRIEVHAKQLVQKSGNYLSPAATVDEIEVIVTTVPLSATGDLRIWSGFSTISNVAQC